MLDKNIMYELIDQYILIKYKIFVSLFVYGARKNNQIIDIIVI